MFKNLLILIFTFFITVAYAQQEYTWDDYGIAFTLSDDFDELENNEEEFSAHGYGIELSIFPFADESIDEMDITTFTMSIAASLELSEIEDINIIELNGFKGGYAEGSLGGVSVFVMGLIDPDSDTNFFVLIGFENTDEEAFNKGVSICESIRKI